MIDATSNLARSGQPGQPDQTNLPNAPIRTAIVGFGLSGRVFHAPLIADNPDFALSAIVTSNSERRALAEATYPGVEVHDSFDALMNRVDSQKDIDLLVIGSPPAVHREQAIAGLNRGLSVVVDKPFAPTAEDATTIIEAATTSAGVLSVFQNRRWDTDFLTLKARIDAGELGRVHTLESRFEGWSSRAPGGWKSTTSVRDGGGTLLDLGPHLVDQAVSLFGPVRDIYAELTRHAEGAGADDDSFVSLLHESGVRSRLWMSKRAPVEGPRFRATGDAAAFVSLGKDPQEAQLGDGMSPSDEAYGWFDGPSHMQIHPTPTSAVPGTGAAPTSANEARPADMVRGDYPEFYRGMARAIRGDAEVPVDPRDSARVLALLEKIHADFPVRRA